MGLFFKCRVVQNNHFWKCILNCLLSKKPINLNKNKPIILETPWIVPYARDSNLVASTGRRAHSRPRSKDQGRVSASLFWALFGRHPINSRRTKRTFGQETRSATAPPNSQVDLLQKSRMLLSSALSLRTLGFIRQGLEKLVENLI